MTPEDIDAEVERYQARRIRNDSGELTFPTAAEVRQYREKLLAISWDDEDDQ